MATEILLFECDHHYFGLRSEIVVEVLRSVALSVVPQSSEVLLGVANLRGKVLPVLNTRHLLGLPTVRLHPSHHFIVVDAGGLVIALHVDRAVELAQVDSEGGGNVTAIESEVADPPSNIEFITKTDVGLVPVINLRNMVTQNHFAELLSLSSSGTSTGHSMQ
ncbi:chemotaxis protein CheW [Novipirellula artificiosorum]|uniref:chemotaxis protein CheW n=1 Tax=Novipirellula artificiosorum TaxID=2528016 RepID=UPI0018CD3895|nr:chemotaxis protein CheW [Novipirellula artificiosorum]